MSTGEDKEALTSIRWPSEFDPTYSSVWVRNELRISASVQDIWLWLVSASVWHSYYENASQVQIEDKEPALRSGSRFKWKTFGLHLQSQVLEFVPNERIAWLARGLGIKAYHAWVLTPESPNVCFVRTEESQRGALPYLGKFFSISANMHRQHQLWLEGLARRASAGPPKLGD